MLERIDNYNLLFSLMEEKERQEMPTRRRRSEGSLIASSMWGAGILISIAIVAGSVAITFAILKSSLFVSSDASQKAGSAVAPAVGNQAAPSAANVPAPTEKTVVTASMGSSPVLGNPKTAKVAIVEWTDLECPFCKQFHDQTFDSIVKNYVDTGQALFVLRNYPLSFHGEAAIKEANAALCVREAAGDKAYFSFVGDVYATTGTNGKGMSDETLASLAAKAGGKSLASCISDQKFKRVIDADLQEGTDTGISGTPGFVIGKISSGGSVEGELISGAMPYSEFKKAIDAALGS